jgi:hypothetical protein
VGTIFIILATTQTYKKIFLLLNSWRIRLHFLQKYVKYHLLTNFFLIIIAKGFWLVFGTWNPEPGTRNPEPKFFLFCVFDISAVSEIRWGGEHLREQRGRKIKIFGVRTGNRHSRTERWTNRRSGLPWSGANYRQFPRALREGFRRRTEPRPPFFLGCIPVWSPASFGFHLKRGLVTFANIIINKPIAAYTQTTDEKHPGTRPVAEQKKHKRRNHSRSQPRPSVWHDRLKSTTEGRAEANPDANCHGRFSGAHRTV